jgi:hypothetical protein
MQEQKQNGRPALVNVKLTGAGSEKDTASRDRN